MCEYFDRIFSISTAIQFLITRNFIHCLFLSICFFETYYRITFCSSHLISLFLPYLILPYLTLPYLTLPYLYCTVLYCTVLFYSFFYFSFLCLAQGTRHDNADTVYYRMRFDKWGTAYDGWLEWSAELIQCRAKLHCCYYLKRLPLIQFIFTMIVPCFITLHYIT